MAKNYILCVDDDLQVLSSLKQQLANGLAGEYSFELAESGEEGLDILQELLDAGNTVPVVISDQLMPGMKGDQFLVHVQERNSNIRKILLTGQASAGAVGNALNHADLYRFISKPWDEADLLKTVKEAARSFFMDQQLENKVQLLTQINSYARQMAENLQLQPFAKSLLDQLLKDTGSQRASLTLRNGTIAPQWVLEGEQKNGKTVFREVKVEDMPSLYPVGVLTDVLSNQTQVLLHNAVANPAWGKEPYIASKRVKSLFCAPIVKQDKVLGALYLEHAGEARKYQEEQEQLIHAVLGQASLALDHVLLYQEMEAKVAERTADIQVDHSNLKESIYYASRIQQSMLPSMDTLQRVFPHSFVWYQPRDVVSGDFYWFDQVDGIVYLAVGDCTGHGVPGAFLTMLGVNLLNQVIKERRMRQPDEILHQMHLSLQKLLRREQNSAVADGMDIALISYDTNLGILKTANAHRPIYLHDGKTLTRLPSSRHSLGGSDDLTDEHFEGSSQTIPAGTRLYICTDGITDQFSDDNKKKFTAKRLEELLNQGANMPIAQAGSLLQNRLKVWQGTNKQTDDLLLLGIQF